MKVGNFLLLSTGGVVLLLLFFGINYTQKYSTSFNDTNRQISKDKTLDTDTTQAQKNKDVFHRSVQDSSTLGRVLQEGGFLTQMNFWNGKVLFVKFNLINSTSEFRYYSHNAFYKDINANKIQDKLDQGFFNPASTIKVSIAALALEKVNKTGFSRELEYRVVGSYDWFRIDDDIRRSLVISDNDATNRLILWLGFDQINHDLKNKGLTYLTIGRLMLNRGVLIQSPSFEMRLGNKLIRQAPKSASSKVPCYETLAQIGNCATASDLVGVLIRLVQPEYFSDEQNFDLTQPDREWLQEIMSHTPRKEGFDYSDDYCRFLTKIEHKIASKSGRMLSKCGVALFSNTYVDSSFIETDSGQKYYIIFSVNPPKDVSEKEVIQWMNTVTNFVLPRLS